MAQDASFVTLDPEYRSALLQSATLAFLNSSGALHTDT